MIGYLEVCLGEEKKKGFSGLSSLGLSGEDLFDGEGNVIGLDKVYGKFGEGVMNKGVVERSKGLYNMLGVGGSGDMCNEIGNMMWGCDKMSKMLEEYDKKWGIVEEVSEERLKSGEGMIEGLKCKFEKLVVNIG